MRLIGRLSRFISIGIISTLVHYLALGLFLWMNLELWVANLIAFTLAFMFSFSWQQRYTFRDRLGSNFSLNQKAAFVMFSLNLVFSGISGKLVQQPFSFILPLVPAFVNYCSYYYLSGLKLFKGRN